jgi:hypothetical protein
LIETPESIRLANALGRLIFMIGMIPELNDLASIRLANTGKAVQLRWRDVIDGCDGIASSQQPVASSQSPVASSSF